MDYGQVLIDSPRLLKVPVVIPVIGVTLVSRSLVLLKIDQNQIDVTVDACVYLDQVRYGLTLIIEQLNRKLAYFGFVVEKMLPT